MSNFFKPQGTQVQYKPNDTRRDVRRLDQRIQEALLSEKGGEHIMFGMVVLSGVTYILPVGGEITLSTALLMRYAYMRVRQRLYNFPWRVPIHAKLFDASKNLEQLNQEHKGNVRKYNPEKLYGEGVTYFGVCRETGLPVYSTNSDDRTHLTCLGTTGSGKTEFLLALVGNQLVQNSGLIYVDAKGDPSLQLNISRIARRFGRDDDILTINFITSGRTLSRAQPDKVTNTFNMMADTSDGMLIEFLNNLLDDGGGGDGMWKGRAMTFIAAITRVLTYLRDNGHIQLSPSVYIQYMELSALEELVFEHDNKYGETFPQVSASLKSYLVSLPGYNTSPKARKKQEQKTVEQHGYVIMQLTKAISDLTYNYGHIFGVQQGDIDIFDCVLNRRILTIPLPALERSDGSMKMLGKLCIGSVKQMMAGSLGNRIQGLVREILDSRPTNAPNAFKLIFDEFGYIVISGVSVMPAQGRSLSFSICFAAQDFSDIKRGNENEAEAIWGNSNVKAIGRIVTGDNGDTMNKVNGVTGEEFQARASSTELEVTDLGDKYTSSTNTQFVKERSLPYSDLAGQENGEFTLLVSKKVDGGASAGVRVIRIKSFYVAGGVKLKFLRMNDLSPNFSIAKDRLVNPTERINTVIKAISGKDRDGIGKHCKVSNLPVFKEYGALKNVPEYEDDPIGRIKSFLVNTLPIKIGEDSSVEDHETIDDVGSSIADQYTQIDKEQSKKALNVEIEAAVKQGIQLDSELINKFTDGAKSLPAGVVQTVDIAASLKEHEGISINIFSLLKYAKECEERLKRHDYDPIPTQDNFGLLPFVPSQAEDSAETALAYKRLEEVNTKTGGKSQVSTDNQNILMQINTDCFTAMVKADTGENRTKMVELIRKSKGQITAK